MSRSEQVALLGLGCALLVALVVIGRGSRAPEPVAVSTPGAAAQIRVHVVGEVVWPGSYLLNAGTRVQDAILAAHGPTQVADLNRVNLAATLRDGDRVVVPRIIQPPYPRPGLPESESATEAPAPGGPRVPAEARRAGRIRPSPQATAAGETAQTVNVNTATAADLERLPGIGPVLARRIVEHREAKGLFRRLDDLLEVKGIGPKMLRRLQPLLRLDEGTEPAPNP